MINKFYNMYALFFGKIFFVKLNKFLFNLSLRGLGILNYKIEYLNGEKAFLKKYLKEKTNPVIIDVGANVGDYCLEVLRINSNSSIFAFEPHPVTYSKLVSNLNNKSQKLFNVGVGDKNDMLELYDYSEHDGSEHASLYHDVITDLHKESAISHQVKVVKLDDFLFKEKVDIIDLLKIDTEGNEFKVLLGLKEYINKGKIKAIHFEFNEMNIVSKVSFKDFWDLLSSKYNLYRIIPGGELLEINNYSPIGCEVYAYQNIVALLNDKVD